MPLSAAQEPNNILTALMGVNIANKAPALNIMPGLFFTKRVAAKPLSTQVNRACHCAA